MDMYARVRRACMVDGMSTREASRVFGLHRDTVRKMLEYPVPPGYRRQSPPHRPKLEPYRGVIDRILEDDRSLPKKQRHTAKRIYGRLRAEHGFGGKYTIVKDYVREGRVGTREMYVPLSHPAGDAPQHRLFHIRRSLVEHQGSIAKWADSAPANQPLSVRDNERVATAHIVSAFLYSLQDDLPLKRCPHESSRRAPYWIKRLAWTDLVPTSPVNRFTSADIIS